MSSLPLPDTPSTEHQESARMTNSRPPSPRGDVTSRLLTELGNGEGSSHTNSTVIESILPVLQQLAGTVKALQAPGQFQPNQANFRAPPEGDIAKFKATITYDGTADLEPFLFALNQSIRKYRLTSNENKLIALGDSLRGEAMGWWTHQKYDTYVEAVIGLEKQFKDLGRHGEYLKKLNRLVQTSTVREFFREAENLNQHAHLPEDALWLTLKQ